MDKNRLELIRNIFDEVAGLPAEDREQALNLKCGNDTELKNEVLSLLQSVDSPDDFLELPSQTDEEKQLNKNDPFIGKHIGPYLIEGEAGVGGMGIVYTGKRDDKSFKQRVAIKILKHGFTSSYFLKRFFRERQTLANLQHPNIARLLDGGSTDDGLPYLVLEFIDGDSITEYCDKNKLTIKERLELFRIVCSAVQYAHQNLVIHRDLKPGNILVDKNGKPKLLDFGIAKLLDEDIEDESEGLTRTGVWHLTPDYASPEQIKGELITTASDIYSLGILLYQLLTGHQPYKITTKTPVAINNTLSEVALKKPSDKIIDTEEIKASDGTIEIISPETVSILRKEKSEKLKQHLQGDLDNIILKAISKEPQRRYASVEQFSEDIRRHLIGLPVIARSDTVGYRVSKFITRHKLGVAFTAAFILFLIISVIGIRIQANIAATERDKATIETKKLSRVNKFLQGMLSSVDPGKIGRDVKVYDVLEQASKDIETELKDQPEIEAEIRETIGNTYTNLGEYKQAKIHLTKALELNEKIYGGESPEVAGSLHDLALYYHWLSDFQIADSLYKKSVDIYRRILTEPTQSMSDAITDYALLQNDLGNYKKADTLLRNSLEIVIKINGDSSIEAATVMNDLAITLDYLHNLEEAKKYYLNAQKIFIDKLGENRPEVATTYNNLAFIEIDKNNLALAEKYFLKSYRLKVKLKGKNHPDVGLALNNLGSVKFLQKDYNKAESYLKDALKVLKKSFNDNHVWIGKSYYWLGKTLMEKSELKEAEKSLRKSLTIRKNLYPDGHQSIYLSEGELGICLLKENKFSDASKLLSDAYNGCNNSLGQNDKNTRRYLEHLIVAYTKSNQVEKAVSLTKILKNTSKN